MPQQTAVPKRERLYVLTSHELLQEFRRKAALAGVSMNAAINACMRAVVDDVVDLADARAPKAVVLKRIAAAQRAA